MPDASQSSAPAPAGLQPASWTRRIGGLVIDWIACELVVIAIFGTRSSDAGAAFYPLIAFWLESAVGTALLGASFGQIFTRIRVLRTDGRPLSLFMALLRSLLVCLVVPPLVFRPDGRGLHDMATGSGAYRLPVTR